MIKLTDFLPAKNKNAFAKAGSFTWQKWLYKRRTVGMHKSSQAEITLAFDDQSLEPRGIGARSLSECLLLQQGKKQDTSVEELW